MASSCVLNLSKAKNNELEDKQKNIKDLQEEVLQLKIENESMRE